MNCPFSRGFDEILAVSFSVVPGHRALSAPYRRTCRSSLENLERCFGLDRPELESMRDFKPISFNVRGPECRGALGVPKGREFEKPLVRTGECAAVDVA